jgi:hypothetical protein
VGASSLKTPVNLKDVGETSKDGSEIYLTPLDELLQNPAPEGRSSLAQRFSAGKSGKKD